MNVVKLLPNSSAYLLRMMSSKVITSRGPVESKILEKLKSLDPFHFEIHNESYKHNVPKGSESHFKLLIVSDLFVSKSPLERHRMVNNVLREELSNDIHALSIETKTIAQWQANPIVAQTPKCLGGSNISSNQL